MLAWLLELLAKLLNLRALDPELPAELAGWHDAEAYRRSQLYARARIRFGAVAATYDLLLLLGFWGVAGFAWLDRLVRSAGLGPVSTGLLFVGALLVARALADLPFAIYGTFVLEERFGFNRTTPRTFVLDLVKGLFVALVLGGPLLALLLLLFESAGERAWLYCWVVTGIFTIVVQALVPTLIMPLFNRFTPLASGELRSALEAYAESVRFPLDGIFVIDGSRRSSKSNAFFTGLGKRKRIALFDTLVERHPVRELVAVLAHEVGHYRKGHILLGTALSILHAGMLFFLLSLFLGKPGLYAAFGIAEPSVYAGFVFFGLLLMPVELALSIVLNAVSRRHERQADRFAVSTTGDPAAMADALRRLSVENLSNLTPHPLDVLLHHSHPPVIERLRAIEAVDEEPSAAAG